MSACGALTHIHLYNVRKVYSKHTSSPQARKFWVIIRLYTFFYSTFRSFLARRRRKFFGLTPHISRPWGGKFSLPPHIPRPWGGSTFSTSPPYGGEEKNPLKRLFYGCVSKYKIFRRVYSIYGVGELKPF